MEDSTLTLGSRVRTWRNSTAYARQKMFWRHSCDVQKTQLWRFTDVIVTFRWRNGHVFMTTWRSDDCVTRMQWSCQETTTRRWCSTCTICVAPTSRSSPHSRRTGQDCNWFHHHHEVDSLFSIKVTRLKRTFTAMANYSRLNTYQPVYIYVLFFPYLNENTEFIICFLFERLLGTPRKGDKCFCKYNNDLAYVLVELTLDRERERVPKWLTQSHRRSSNVVNTEYLAAF